MFSQHAIAFVSQIRYGKIAPIHTHGPVIDKWAVSVLWMSRMLELRGTNNIQLVNDREPKLC